MRRILTFASFCVAFAMLAQAARADLVSDFWQGVNTWATANSYTGNIRVVFVTSPVVDAINTSHSYYDAFGDDSAVGNGITSFGGAVTSSFGLTKNQWNPLVTAVGDAGGSPVLTALNAFGGTLPVFNTRGQLVSASSAAMLGGLSNAIRYDESADDQVPNGSVGVWTGTGVDGNVATGAGGPFPLGGSTSTIQKASGFGDGGSTTNSWLFVAASNQQQQVFGSPSGQLWDPVMRSIYVMSDEITIVPEPTTLAMWLGFGGLAGLVFWRKRRKNS